jgi:hypothetical protein
MTKPASRPRPTAPQYELTITLRPAAPGERRGIDSDRTAPLGLNLVANALGKLPPGTQVRLLYDVPGERSE